MENKEELKQAILEAKAIEDRKKIGTTPGIFSILFAILGLFLLTPLFVPFAIIIGLLGGISALSVGNVSGIAFNIIGLILSVFAIFTSPTMLVMIGASQ